MSILAPYGISLVRSSLTGRANDTGIEEDTPSYQLGGSICTSEVLDETLGMQELEDATAEDQWHHSEAYGQGTLSCSV